MSLKTKDNKITNLNIKIQIKTDQDTRVIN